MYENILSTIKKMDTVENIGKIENIVGMSMEASGTGKSSIGDICMIYSDETESQVPRKSWASRETGYSL